MVRRDIVAYYRKHDDFRRYLIENMKRVEELSQLYLSFKRYFGRVVLDLACGGGVLGFVVEPRGHRYVGVDINPDMVKSARQYVKETASHNQFITGDIRSSKLDGVYDTVALLGNALIHFNVIDFTNILKNVDGNVHSGSFFLVDYRDVVEMLFKGRWGKKYTQRRGGMTIVSLTKGIDTQRGDILIRSLFDSTHHLAFSHAIWSPFIMESIMRARSWKHVERKSVTAWRGWMDIYKRE